VHLLPNTFNCRAILGEKRGVEEEENLLLPLRERSIQTEKGRVGEKEKGGGGGKRGGKKHRMGHIYFFFSSNFIAESSCRGKMKVQEGGGGK